MIITNKLSDKCLNFIKSNTTIPETDLEKIYYGLQVIMMDMSKTIILFTTGYLLGILKYMFIAFIAFTILRSFASGVHANSTLQCIIVNYILFLGNVYLSLNFSINIIVQSIIFIISLILVFLYAPGDTEERPLVSKKLRRRLKIKSLAIVISFYIIILLIKNNIYTNLITYSVLEESLVITPIVYKLFGKKTNNYKNI
jgi:accessory gene regulator B